MSTQPIGSSTSSASDPTSYSYTLPAALASGSATSPANSAAASAGTSYQQEYATLQQQDAAELMQVSFASSADAASNVSSVLAQASALQAQQLAAQQQAAAAGVASPPSTGASDPLNLPTIEQLTSQSDSDAATALSTWGQPPSSGTTVDTTA